MLNHGQRFGQDRLVAAVQEYIVRGGGVDIEANGGTDHKRDCFGLGLADCVRRFLASLSAMKQFMSAFMSERCQMLGRRKIRK